MMLVSDVMLPLDRFPVIQHDVILKVCLEEMNSYKLGIAAIIDNAGYLLGVFTDGDLRRKLLKIQSPLASLFVDDALLHAIHNPSIVKPEDTLVSAVEFMESHQVWDLPVVDSKNKLVGLLHLHPAVQALLFKQQILL